MAHYALLNSKNIVTSVFVGRDENDGDENWESVYSSLYNKTCKRTSYNTIGGVHTNGGTPFRKNYAGIGYKYYVSYNGFAPPKPYASWTLDGATCTWQPPTAKPNDGNFYEWNEDEQSWDLIS